MPADKERIVKLGMRNIVDPATRIGRAKEAIQLELQELDVRKRRLREEWYAAGNAAAGQTSASQESLG